jgi:hypothetical protein
MRLKSALAVEYPPDREDDIVGSAWLSPEGRLYVMKPGEMHVDLARYVSRQEFDAAAEGRSDSMAEGRWIAGFAMLAGGKARFLPYDALTRRASAPAELFEAGAGGR